MYDIYFNIFCLFTGKTTFLKTDNMVGSQYEENKVTGISVGAEIN